MSITIEPLEEYLRVIIRHRTSDDLQAVAATIFAEAEKHQLSRVLIKVEESGAISSVRKLNLQHYLDRVIQAGGAKVALVSDSSEVFASHQYIALLGRQRGVRIKAFRAEDAALSWLLERKSVRRSKGLTRFGASFCTWNVGARTRTGKPETQSPA